MKPIELFNDTFTKDLLDTTVFFKIAESGAMGERGGIDFITEQGKLYHANYLYSDLEWETVQKAFPTINECGFGLFSEDDGVPKGWEYVALGMGNHLIVREDYYSEFEPLIAYKSVLEVYMKWKELALTLWTDVSDSSNKPTQISALSSEISRLESKRWCELDRKQKNGTTDTFEQIICDFLNRYDDHERAKEALVCILDKNIIMEFGTQVIKGINGILDDFENTSKAISSEFGFIAKPVIIVQTEDPELGITEDQEIRAFALFSKLEEYISWFYLFEIDPETHKIVHIKSSRGMGYSYYETRYVDKDSKY